MEVENYEGEDFHPSLEPMVIINSEDDEEQNFFLKLQLCRKSDLKLRAQISHVNRFRNRLNLINQETNFRPDFSDCQNSNNSFSDSTNQLTRKKYNRNKKVSIRPEISIFPVKRKTKPGFKIKLFNKGNGSSVDDKDDIFEEEKVEQNIISERTDMQNKTLVNKTPVRLISKDEAINAEEPYAKRKSSPLEKCPICKKFFRRMKTHLLKHEILETHDASSGLICIVCNKAFNNQSNLLIHMRTHTGDKPYPCIVCNKSFSQSCNLVNHMRIHTGEKPFKCPHCDRAFTQSGNLNNHIRLHTDEKPFKCHFCDKAFVQSGNLNSHIRNNHRFKEYQKTNPLLS